MVERDKCGRKGLKAIVQEESKNSAIVNNVQWDLNIR